METHYRQPWEAAHFMDMERQREKDKEIAMHMLL